MLARFLERSCEHHHSCCGRCGMPWCQVKAGPTIWYKPGTGVSPLCEFCYGELTPAERVPFFDELVNWWLTLSMTPRELAEHEAARPLIKAAVLAERTSPMEALASSHGYTIPRPK
jgi:hypothetical protein